MSARHLIFTLLSLISGASAFPQAATSPGTPPDVVKAIATSREFNQLAKEAAQEGMLTAEASKLAIQRSTNAKIRQFAADMVSEQETANENLAAVCREGHENVTTSLDEEHSKQLQTLWNAPADAFDSNFLNLLGNINDQEIGIFQRGAKVDDPQFANFATNRLDVLKHRSASLETFR